MEGEGLHGQRRAIQGQRQGWEKNQQEQDQKQEQKQEQEQHAATKWPLSQAIPLFVSDAAAAVEREERVRCTTRDRRLRWFSRIDPPKSSQCGWTRRARFDSF